MIESAVFLIGIERYCFLLEENEIIRDGLVLFLLSKFPKRLLKLKFFSDWNWKKSFDVNEERTDWSFSFIWDYPNRTTEDEELLQAGAERSLLLFSV